jgi:hypothetical protein
MTIRYILVTLLVCTALSTAAAAVGFHACDSAEPKQLLNGYAPAPVELETVTGMFDFPGGLIRYYGPLREFNDQLWVPNGNVLLE